MGLKAVQFSFLLLLSYSTSAQMEKSDFYSRQSHYYFDEDRWSEAELYADSAIVLAIRSNVPDSIANAYRWMYEVHLAKKDFQKALTDFRLATVYRDSVRTLKQIRTEIEQREWHQKEVSLLKEQIQEWKQMAENDRRNATLLFFALLLFLIIIIFIYYRKNIQLGSDLASAAAELGEQKAFRRKLYSVLSKEAGHSLSAIGSVLTGTSNGGENDIWLNRARFHVHHLQITLEHIIQWLGYQSNEKKVMPEDIDCKVLTDEVLGRFRPQLAEKRLTTDIFIPESQIAFADKMMIEIVMENLISNAIRFTKEGGKITFFSGRKDDLVTLGIKDSGIGISQAHLHGIFNMTQDVGSGEFADDQGAGMGLVLSKDLVEHNGGRMYAESVEGQGSTFYFSLPGKKLPEGV